ncbi:MAG: hypothetical protein K9K68_07760, partial [Methylococcaceae bacterium]|nr:hypothetical protein [Methylococcaceae bacterium]
MLFSRGAARAGYFETGSLVQKFLTGRGAGLTFNLLLFVLFILPCGELLAHERWILTPEQIQEWSEKPTPELWNTLTLLNGSMILGFVIFTIGWIRLGFTGARELFPDLQARLGSFGYLVAPILRFCL